MNTRNFAGIGFLTFDPSKPVSPSYGSMRPGSESCVPCVGFDWGIFKGDLIGFLSYEFIWVRVTHKSQEENARSSGKWDEKIVAQTLKLKKKDLIEAI